MNIETDNRNTTGKRMATLVRSGAADITAGENIERELLREHCLELEVNGQTMEQLVCTAEDLENLVVGHMITEGIISGVEDIERICLCEDGSRASVFLNEDVRVGSLQSRSRDYKAFPACTWRPEWIFGLADAFAEDFELHRRIGGIHGCMLGMEGRVLYQTEDIGRHNAMDKAIGYAARTGIAPENCMLFTTGRVPTDMVGKALAARIPLLVSKAVPTREAVEMAQRYGLVLICRAWPDSFELYADGGSDK